MTGQRQSKTQRMQRATDNLRADHALTTTAMAVLGEMARQVRSGVPFPTVEGAIVLRYLREFVVAVHFRKEAGILVPALATWGDDHTAGLLGELMRLQDEAAELVHSLVLFWEPEGDLTDPERAGFADTAQLLAQRMNRIQEIEESELFEACDREVPRDDHLGWLHEFEALEGERGSRDAWSGRIADLAAHWLA